MGWFVLIIFDDIFDNNALVIFSCKKLLVSLCFISSIIAVRMYAILLNVCKYLLNYLYLFLRTCLILKVCLIFSLLRLF